MSSRLWVWRLPATLSLANRTSLLQINRVKVVSQPSQGDPPKPRGYGYVEFTTEETMQAALGKHSDVSIG